MGGIPSSSALVALLLIVLVAPRPAAAAPPTAKQLLNEQAARIGPPPQIASWHSKFEGTYRTVGDDGTELQHEWVLAECTHAPQGLDVRFSIGGIDAQGEPSAARISRRAISSDVAFIYEIKGDEAPRQGNYSAKGDSYRNFARAQLQGAEALDGYLAHDPLPFWAHLSEARDVRVERGENGADSLVLRGRSEFGQYWLTIDAKTRLLKGVKVRKKGQDRFDRGTIASTGMERFGKLEAFEFDMSVTGTASNPGTPALIEASIVETKQYSGSRQVTTTKRFRRAAFERGSSSVRDAFRPALPDGVRLNNLDAESVRLVWKDGAARVLLPGEQYQQRIDRALARADVLTPRGPLPHVPAAIPPAARPKTLLVVLACLIVFLAAAVGIRLAVRRYRQVVGC